MSEMMTCEWCAEEIPVGVTRCPKCQGSISPAGKRVDSAPLAARAPAAAPTKPKAPAGWYDDPKLVNTRRYWDGQQWTEHRLEKSAAASAPGAPKPEKQYTSPLGGGPAPDKNTVSLYHWGIVAALLFPLLGFIMGLILLSKKTNWGLRLIVGSIGAAILWYRLVLAGS